MAKSTVKITKHFVDGWPIPRARQDFYWDSELRVFGSSSASKAKPISPRDINGCTRRVTVGRHGVITTDQARQEAREHITHMSKGVDINAKKREARTGNAGRSYGNLEKLAVARCPT